MKTFQVNKNVKDSPVPSLRGELLYIPFVGAIIERKRNKLIEILVQIRQKDTDLRYSGSVEIPGGKFRAFEDVYETIRREIKEETGLDVTLVIDETLRHDYQNKGDRSTLITPYCVTQMENGPFIGLIFRCQVRGKMLQKTNETKNIQWMPINQLAQIVTFHPEQIYTAFLAPLIKYLQEENK